jgi:hypothetical protein
MLDYDSNSCAYRVFSKDSNCVETTCDAVLDKTNGSQVEQYDLDDVDDKQSPCDSEEDDGEEDDSEEEEEGAG